MRARLLVLAVLVAAVLGGSVSPAEAAAASLTVCNSSASTGGAIILWRGDSSSPWLWPGDCWSIFNGDGQARVMVYSGDYKMRRAGGRYGACHNGPNVASNPPDVSWVAYRTKPVDYC